VKIEALDDKLTKRVAGLKIETLFAPDSDIKGEALIDTQAEG